MNSSAPWQARTLLFLALVGARLSEMMISRSAFLLPNCDGDGRCQR
jgi:hypothetical protein